jgi:NAD(P)-dependent dehydrogenase (short-subunit alcohol dehydrogenase family)
MDTGIASGKKFAPVSTLISLADKKALVTGGAMGIGFAIAYRLAEAGATVAIIDVNDERGQKASQDLINDGYQAFFLHCDVSQEEEVKNTIAAAFARMGKLDVLVNNAGIYPFTPLMQMTAADIEKVLSINLKGLIYFSREVSCRMIEQKHGGSFINIASIDALRPSDRGLPVYDASKGAVVSLTKSMARELGPDGIRVNSIAPGGIMTDGTMVQSRSGGEVSRAWLRKFMSRIPLGRMGVADDIGRVALFLASDLSAYVNGSLIVVDGGYLLG